MDTNKGYVVEYSDCKYDNTMQIAKCCESNTGNDTVCRHFKLEGDDNKTVVEEMIAESPNWAVDGLNDTISFTQTT